MGNPFRLKQLIEKLSKLRRLLPLRKSGENQVIEIKDPHIDSSKLDDTDFEYFYPNEILVKMPKMMVERLSSEELDKMLRQVTQGQKFSREDDQTVYIVTQKIKRPWYKRAKTRPKSIKPTTSSSHSDDSETNRPCTLKQRREDRQGLDILHDTICYSQYDMRERHGRTPTQAEIINDFLNTITNDIVDVNKEPIPKDPEQLPALGAAGMHPTKKWLADLKRRGIKPEPSKNYRELKPRTRTRGGFRRQVNHILGTDMTYPWRNTEDTHRGRRDLKKRRTGKGVRMISMRHRSVGSMTDDTD